MRVPKGVIPLALALGLGAAPLHAQGVEFSLGGGIANPLGTAVSGCESSMRTTSEPACWPVLIDWIAFCAIADTLAPTVNTSARAPKRHLLVIC